tara:strand:+ start:301 stop:927 length:627 start_codon:yes stop_codon:yes gene_type:complete
MIGGGASSIQDMINRYRNNVNQLRKSGMFKRDKSYFKLKADYQYVLSKTVDYKSATKEQLAEIKAKVKRKRKQQLIKSTVIYALSAVLTFSILIYLIQPFERIPPELAHNHEIPESESLEKKFNFYVSDGDYWFAQNKWHNAAFQYSKALEIQPNNYGVQLKLANTLTFSCTNDSVQCDEARTLINKLIRKYPNNMELKALRYKTPTK